MIVDMGGGTYARYTQTDAKFNDLSVDLAPPHCPRRLG